MTAQSQATHDNPAHHGHQTHGDHHAGGEAHGSFRGYMTGFVLSVILTVIPFWLVMGDVIGNVDVAAIVIMGLAAVQIVVHMVYFLHMDSRSEGGWTFMALIFTLVVLAITIIGSLWVMFHLNQNMMPVEFDPNLANSGLQVEGSANGGTNGSQ